MKFAILGAGMTGLVVANTLMKNGFTNIDIYERKKSLPDPKGFMVLHDDFGYKDKLDCKTFPVYQMGDEEKYKEKLGYGDNVNCSWKSGLNKYYMKGYNPFQLAEILYTTWMNKIIREEIDKNKAEIICNDYDHVFSTIPPMSYSDEVQTEEVFIFVRESAGNGHMIGVKYNGRSNPLYARQIRLWGKLITEYCVDYYHLDLKRVTKPIRVTKVPDLWYGNMIPVGRRGLWNKHIMLHHVQNRIIGMLNEGVLI